MVTGVGSDGTPMTFLQSVRVDGTGQVARAEPFDNHVYEELELGVELKPGLEFIGHYNEPNLELVNESSGTKKAPTLSNITHRMGCGLRDGTLLLSAIDVHNPEELASWGSVLRIRYPVVKMTDDES
ncbi:silent information regulator family protein [Penicillium freii]|nr:silent information regulator family protein [Penicillium freii]